LTNFFGISYYTHRSKSAATNVDERCVRTCAVAIGLVQRNYSSRRLLAKIGFASQRILLYGYTLRGRLSAGPVHSADMARAPPAPLDRLLLAGGFHLLSSPLQWQARTPPAAARRRHIRQLHATLSYAASSGTPWRRRRRVSSENIARLSPLVSCSLIN